MPSVLINTILTGNLVNLWNRLSFLSEVLFFQSRTQSRRPHCNQSDHDRSQSQGYDLFTSQSSARLFCRMSLIWGLPDTFSYFSHTFSWGLKRCPQKRCYTHRSRLSCIFSTPNHDLAISPKSPDSCSWRRVFRKKATIKNWEYENLHLKTIHLPKPCQTKFLSN